MAGREAPLSMRMPGDPGIQHATVCHSTVSCLAVKLPFGRSRKPFQLPKCVMSSMPSPPYAACHHMRHYIFMRSTVAVSRRAAGNAYCEHHGCSCSQNTNANALVLTHVAFANESFAQLPAFELHCPNRQRRRHLPVTHT